jgi:hypothetical protein
MFSAVAAKLLENVLQCCKRACVTIVTTIVAAVAAVVVVVLVVMVTVVVTTVTRAAVEPAGHTMLTGGSRIRNEIQAIRNFDYR